MTPSSFTDAQLLRMLDLQAEGVSPKAIAARLRCTKNQVIGALYRIRKDTDRLDLTPERNGEMPPKWWRKGLAKQGRANG